MFKFEAALAEKKAAMNGRRKWKEGLSTGKDSLS